MARRALLFLCLFTASVFAVEEDCTLNSGGKYYDLNPLASKTDYTIKRAAPKSDIILNVCKSTAHETWHIIGGGDETKVAGHTRLDRGDFSLGQMNRTFSTGSAPKTLKMIMNNGSPCPSASSMKASTAIEFICDSRVYGVGQPRLVAQLPEDEACAFWIEWRTTFACPTNPPSSFSFFRFLFYTLLSVTIIYLICGTLYNRYVLELHGFEQIPRFSVEAVRWHLKEGLSWARGYESWQSGAGLNPVSHHVVEEGGAGGGFVRPERGRGMNAGSGRGGGPGVGITRGGLGGEINPVSDHAQTQLHAESQQQPLSPATYVRGGGPESVNTRGGLGGEINPVSDYARTQLHAQTPAKPQPPPSLSTTSQPQPPPVLVPAPPPTLVQAPSEEEQSFAIEEDGSGSEEESDSDEEEDEDEDERSDTPQNRQNKPV